MLTVHQIALGAVRSVRPSRARGLRPIRLGGFGAAILVTVVPSVLFALVLVVTIETAKLAGPAQPDALFAPYRSVWPGQLTAGLAKWSCTGLPNLTTPAAESSCVLRNEGPFHIITLTHDGATITEWSAWMGVGQMGDLVTLWGYPDNIRPVRSPKQNVYQLRWGGTVSATVLCPSWLTLHCAIELFQVADPSLVDPASQRGA